MSLLRGFLVPCDSSLLILLNAFALLVTLCQIELHSRVSCFSDYSIQLNGLGGVFLDPFAFPVTLSLLVNLTS